MPADNITNILGKLDELRAVFIIGQRAVPFIEEILHFFKEMSPLLDEINVSIRDSTSKIPKATSQLQSVSQATEMATTEILDLVDAVLLQLSRMKSTREQAAADLDAMGQLDTRMVRLIKMAYKGDNPDLITRIEVLHEQKRALRKSFASKLGQEVGAIDAMRDDINRIMLALQVQDITTQQIAAVKHLFESIRDRLTRLIHRLSYADFEQTVEELLTPTNPGTFDPNATYDRSGQRQVEADEVIAGFVPGRAKSVNGRAKETSPAEPPAERVAACQNDIDALFAAPRPAANPASQDEIDKLFQGL